LKSSRKVKFYFAKYYIKANEEPKEIENNQFVYQFVLNRSQCFDVSTRDRYIYKDFGRTSSHQWE